MSPADRYDSLLLFYAEQHGLDWRLLKAQLRAESAFDPNAKSWVGAKGLAQFMDATWREWSDGTPGVQTLPPGNLVLVDPRDPEDAIRAQAAYMAWLIGIFGRAHVEHAIAAYNWGVGRVLKLRSDPKWKAKLPKETRDYLERILRYLRQYTSDVDSAVAAAESRARA